MKKTTTNGSFITKEESILNPNQSETTDKLGTKKKIKSKAQINYENPMKNLCEEKRTIPSNFMYIYLNNRRRKNKRGKKFLEKFGTCPRTFYLIIYSVLNF